MYIHWYIMYKYDIWNKYHQVLGSNAITLLWESVRMELTLLKWRLRSLPGLSKFQSSIAGDKTPCIGVIFMSLENYQSVDVEMGLHEPFGHLQNKLWQKERLGVKLVVDSRPLKVRNWPDPDVCRWSATCHWKALNESYKFALDFIPIGGLNKKLWPRKIVGVQTGIVLGLLLGSPGTKIHLDVGAAERPKEYYMGESGGFPRVQAVVSFVSLGSPVTCSSIKGVLESEPAC
jgi:hypothetical protein